MLTSAIFCLSRTVQNKGFLVLFSVHQGKWIDLLLDRFWFSISCTLVTLVVLTGIDTNGYDIMLVLDVDNSRRHNASNNCNNWKKVQLLLSIHSSR